MDTITWQRLEGAGVCLSALALFAFLGDGIAWWLAAVLFFAPDISFAGYLAGPRIGAIAYNLVHLYAFGAVLLAVGIGLDTPVLTALGTSGLILEQRAVCQQHCREGEWIDRRATH